MQIGELARAALERSGGLALPLAQFADAPYLSAAGEIIWVGAQLPTLHPRAVMTTRAPPRGVALRFDSLPPHGWSTQLPVLDQATANAVIAGADKLRRKLAAVKTARGFGALLTGRPADFPLDVAVAHVRALTSAYERNDADAAVEASRCLLGFGTGLTPAGDDLAGAALFGRRLIDARHTNWAGAAATLAREVITRSHAISAALFSDLARGQSFAPLHAIAEALVRDDDDGAMQAAQSLVAIGHSSGWDMMCGLIIGTTANLS